MFSGQFRILSVYSVIKTAEVASLFISLMLVSYHLNIFKATSLLKKLAVLTIDGKHFLPSILQHNMSYRQLERDKA